MRDAFLRLADMCFVALEQRGRVLGKFSLLLARLRFACAWLLGRRRRAEYIPMPNEPGLMLLRALQRAQAAMPPGGRKSFVIVRENIIAHCGYFPEDHSSCRYLGLSELPALDPADSFEAVEGLVRNHGWPLECASFDPTRPNPPSPDAREDFRMTVTLASPNEIRCEYEVVVACSPKADPSGMRVFSARRAGEILDEEEAA